MIPGLVGMTGLGTVQTEFIDVTTADGGLTLTITKPTGVISGDLLVAIVCAEDTTSWSGDTGWTEVAEQVANPALRVAYKVAGASEPANYSFTLSIVEDAGTSGAILAYRRGLFDAVGSFNTSDPIVAPEITMSRPGILLAAYAVQNVSTFTVPSGMELRASDSNATKPSYAIFDQEVTDGATGSRSSTPSTGTNRGGILIGIKST